MKRKVMIGFLLMIALAILSGCAGVKHELVFNDESQIEINEKPVMLAGIPFRNYEQDQEFIVVLNDFLLYEEYNQFRIRWDILNLDPEGNVYSGVLFSQLNTKNPNGKFYANCKVQAKNRKDINVIVLSTGAVMGFNATGEEGFIVYRDLLESSAEYRKELYKKGTPLSYLPNPKEFDSIIEKWKNKRNRFKTPYGNIITPWPKEIIVDLAKINTKETVGDRAISRRWGFYFPNIPGTILGLGIDGGSTLFGSYKGWDMDSNDDKDRQFSHMLLEEARENAVIRIYRKEN